VDRRRVDLARCESSLSKTDPAADNSSEVQLPEAGKQKVPAIGSNNSEAGGFVIGL